MEYLQTLFVTKGNTLIVPEYFMQNGAACLEIARWFLNSHCAPKLWHFMQPTPRPGERDVSTKGFHNNTVNHWSKTDVRNTVAANSGRWQSEAMAIIAV